MQEKTNVQGPQETAPSLQNKKDWQAPKLSFVKPKLTKHGSLEEVTGGAAPRLTPVDQIFALRVLLSQSAPQLFDRDTMGAHLELLKRLLRQCELYRLDAGIDLYRRPAKLIELLAEAQGETSWPALSLS